MQGIGDDIYDDAREHRNDGGEYLHAELEPCVEVKNIVYRTDDGDEYRTDQDASDLRCDIRKQKHRD